MTYNPLNSGPFNLECQFTDAGMHPLQQTVTSFDQIFTMMVRLNQTYTRLTVRQNGSVVMSADRRIGEDTWNVRFFSNLFEVRKPKFQPGQEVYHAASEQVALVTEILHDIKGIGRHYYSVQYQLNGLFDSLPESELVALDKMSISS